MDAREADFDAEPQKFSGAKLVLANYSLVYDARESVPISMD